MAIPKPLESEETNRLHAIVDTAPVEEVLAWAGPTDTDLALIGRIIVLYSSIDAVLQAIVEEMENKGMLKDPYAGKMATTSITRVSEAIQSSPVWEGPNKLGFQKLDDYRRVRNMLAHFFVRRFPKDDGFVFFTKSAHDYKQVMGVMPPPSTWLFAVTPEKTLSGLVPELRDLLKWCSKLPGDLAKPSKSNV